MPTSSQAKFLKNEHSEGNTSNPRKFHVPTGSRPKSRADLNALNGPKEKNCQIMEKIFQEKGLHPQLLYNPVSGCFAYRFKFSEQSLQMVRPKSRVDFEDQNDTRSKSANVTKCNKEGRKRLGTHIALAENILSLGFRGLNKKSTRREVKSAHLASDTHKRHPISDPGTETRQGPGIQLGITKVYKKQPTATKASKHRKLKRDEERTSPRYENLLLPAVYLRKTPARKDPLTVCFSLRDNESTTHGELKNHVEVQVEVTITQLQYEPLSVRSGDPSINGRWLATMKNLFEVDSLLRKGFYMDGDHIIVKAWDEIADREYQKYKYLQGMDSERDKLNLPTSKLSKKFHKLNTVIQGWKLRL